MFAVRSCEIRLQARPAKPWWQLLHKAAKVRALPVVGDCQTQRSVIAKRTAPAPLFDHGTRRTCLTGNHRLHQRLEPYLAITDQLDPDNSDLPIVWQSPTDPLPRVAPKRIWQSPTSAGVGHLPQPGPGNRRPDLWRSPTTTRVIHWRSPTKQIDSWQIAFK